MPDGSNPREIIGGNNPPPYREDVVTAHDAKAAEFLDAAGEWLDLKVIQTAEQASELADFITGLRKNWKACDEDRKADKKPHDDAGKSVQAAYTPILNKITKAADRVQPMQTAWLQKLEEEHKAAAARIAEEARKAREEADRQAAMAAARNDIAGETEAEASAKRADDMAKEAERASKARAQVKSASGGGRTASLRTTWEAEVVNPRVAFMRYADHPEVLAVLRQLAEAEARAKGFEPETDKIPGIILHKRQK